MNNRAKYRNTGYRSFFLSGICAISSGVIVSLLQNHYGFAYSITGILISCMSIGNMISSFASGFLPGIIGTRNTVMILCSGYLIGYLLMSFTGAVPLLILSFLLVGFAKGCTINNCTVLVGENSEDRAKGLSLMNAFYALGALLCPFFIGFLEKKGANLPMRGIALVGFLLWLNFMMGGLPGVQKKTAKDQKKQGQDFWRSKKFWLITALIFCQNAAETGVTGWLVTYYRGQHILDGALSTYTVTVMWGATLIARLLLAFVVKIEDTFLSLALMGIGCTVMYGLMVFAHAPILAILLLFAFSFAIAGVYPIGVAGVGKIMSNTSLGVLFPIGGIGAIVMPWVIGMVADAAGLKIAMLTNLVPCLGIALLSVWIRKLKE